MAFGRYFFGTSGNEANVIIQYYLVPVAFPVTPKYMTLNDPDGLFGLKFVFAPVWLAETARLRKIIA